jgi:hypothetical protein
MFLDHRLLVCAIAPLGGVIARYFKVALVNDIFNEAASILDRKNYSASRTLLLGNPSCTSATDDVTVAALIDWSAGARDGEADGALQEIFKVI